MSTATVPPGDLFRTIGERGLPESARIDDKTRTIVGAKALQVGALNVGDARPWKIDETTLEQFVALAGEKGQGVKSRFSHPNMSRDGMGRHLGRAVNPRIVRPESGEPAFAAVDVALSKTSARTPQGDLGGYVLEMAKETPEDFGLSIAFAADHAAMDAEKPDDKGLVPVRLRALKAVDFVDEPAATKGGLFSLDSDSPADLPAQATHLLDTFFGDADADTIRQRFGDFLNRYLTNRGDGQMSQPETAKIVEPTPAVTPPAQPQLASDDGKENAKAELTRQQQIAALCALAKVPDSTRDLLFASGMSRQEAADWLKTSNALGANQTPIGESGNAGAEKPKPSKADEFAAEFDANQEALTLIGVTKEQYVKSALKSAGLSA